MKMKIEEIHISKYPLVIITDVHCHINRIDIIRAKHRNCDIICLGDITDLFSKVWTDFNKTVIEYFIKNKIPCLTGNHEAFIVGCDSGDSFVISNVSDKSMDYNVEPKHIEYLKSLPIGFKLVLPDGSNYLCYHNRPNDLWGFTNKKSLTAEQFKKTYPIEENTIGILHGHGHQSFIEEYENVKPKRFSIGAVKEKEYALLTENGIEFKKL